MLRVCSQTLLYWFWVETVLKMIAFHKAFHKDKFDMFDLLVNIVTTMSLFFSGASSVTALRSIRQVCGTIPGFENTTLSQSS